MGNGEGKEGKAKWEKGEGEERERMLEGKWELEVECLESGKEGTKVRERGRNGMGKRGMVGKWERNGKEGREKASGDKVWEEKLELEGKRKEGKEQGGKLGMLTIRIRWL